MQRFSQRNLLPSNFLVSPSAPCLQHSLHIHISAVSATVHYTESSGNKEADFWRAWNCSLLPIYGKQLHIKPSHSDAKRRTACCRGDMIVERFVSASWRLGRAVEWDRACSRWRFRAGRPGQQLDAKHHPPPPPHLFESPNLWPLISPKHSPTAKTVTYQSFFLSWQRRELSSRCRRHLKLSMALASAAAIDMSSRCQSKRPSLQSSAMTIQQLLVCPSLHVLHLPIPPGSRHGYAISLIVLTVYHRGIHGVSVLM